MAHLLPSLNTNINQQVLTNSYSVIFSYNGIGELEYFEVNFSENDWQIKLEMDGKTAFELNNSNLENFTFAKDQLGYFKIKNFGKDFLYQPIKQFLFDNTIKIYAKRTDGTANCSRILVAYNKEMDL